MKKIVILFLFINLFAFEVEFTKIYKKFLIPKKPAIEIITKANNLSFPFNYIKTKNGYILYGDLDEINMWLDNNFYAPNDAKFKTIKISFVDMDKIQYKIIQKIKKTYNECNIKKIIFLTPDEDKIITKPQNIQIKYKIILDCK